MSITTIDPISSPEWLNFIESQPKATMFHHPAWLSVLHKQYKFPVFAVCMKNSSGSITAGMPFCEVKHLTGKKKWVSLPFSDQCEPLYKDASDLENILDYLISQQTTGFIDSIEVRSPLPLKGEFLESADAVLHKMELHKDPEKAFSIFKNTHARGIKKSLREGLITEVLSTKESLEEFYRLHLKTRKKQGVPIQPKSFFIHFFSEIIEKKKGFIVLVQKADRPIAAGVFAFFNSTLTYKYGASDLHFLRLRPNNLMFWTSIHEACARGLKYLDLGKTDHANNGLRDFKSGFGAIETPLYYSYYPDIPEKGKFTFINNKIVSPLIKTSPDILCRITGELLYKYTA